MDKQAPTTPTDGMRRSGFVLLMTVLLLALLAAVVAQLVFASSAATVVGARRNGDLIHRLAVDSAIAWSHAESQQNPNWSNELDRSMFIERAFTVGTCRVRMRLRDDGAKFDVAAFADPRDAHLLEAKLRRLEYLLRLPRMRPRLQPIRQDVDATRIFVWFDQLFDRPEAHRIFAVTDNSLDRMRWSDVLTVFGDGRLDLRRADRDMLEIMLGDLVPGIGNRLPPVGRRTGPAAEAVLADVLADLDEQTRNEVSRRVAWDLGRYALWIRTAIATDDGRESDVRRWYVVATFSDGPPTVHYRGQIRW